jgi:hypothetical protein
VLQTRECVSTPSPSIIFIFGLVVMSIKKFGGASQMVVDQTFEEGAWLCFQNYLFTL